MASTGIDIPEFEEEHIIPQVTYPKIKGKERMVPRIPIGNVEFSEPSTPDSKRAEPSGFIHPPSETSSNRHMPNENTPVLQQLEDKRREIDKMQSILRAPLNNMTTQSNSESMDDYIHRIPTQAQTRIHSERSAALGAPTNVNWSNKTSSEVQEKVPFGRSARYVPVATRPLSANETDGVSSGARPPTARPLLLDSKNRITGRNSMNTATSRPPNMSAIPPAQTPQRTMVTFKPRAPVAPVVAPAHAQRLVRPSIALLSSTDTTESRILNIINFAQESVVNEPPYPAAVSKSMSKLTPSNYSGSSSFKDFERFVTRLLHHFTAVC